MVDLQQILATTSAVAREAGNIIRDNYGKTQRIDYKGAVNPVTETDMAAEALIIERLQADFPDHHILGEESGGSSWQTQAPLWLIDPLDGTNNFAHGFPHFCVSLGLALKGQVVVGVIYDPLRDELFSAQRGEPATCNGSAIHVSDKPRLRDALLGTGFPYVRRTAADNNTRTLDHFLRRSQGIRRAGSAALDLAYVASGRLDGYWEAQLHPWDLAAGILLVEAAGGSVSDYSGTDENLLSGKEMVASNQLIHQEMLQVLRLGAAAPHPDYPELL